MCIRDRISTAHTIPSRREYKALWRLHRKLIATLNFCEYSPRQIWRKTWATSRKNFKRESTTFNVELCVRACDIKTRALLNNRSSVRNAAVLLLWQRQVWLCVLKSLIRNNGDGSYSTTSWIYPARYSESGKYKGQIVIFSNCNKLITTACRYVARQICYIAKKYDNASLTSAEGFI